jgi:O-antigen ligase
LALVALLYSEPSRRGSGESAFLWFGLAAIIGAGIAAAASRGASLAAALALAALLILYLLGPQRGILVGATGIVAAALLLFFAPSFGPAPPPVAAGGGGSSAGMSWVVHAASASTALDLQPLGAGIGAFASSFQGYPPPTIHHAAGFAHGDLLQELAGLGLPLLAVFAVTAFVALLGARGIFSRPRSPRCTWGAVIATLSLSAHSLIDSPLDVPAIALSGAALAGLAFAGIGIGEGRQRMPDWARSAAATRWTVAGLSIALLAIAANQAAALATW